MGIADMDFLRMLLEAMVLAMMFLAIVFWLTI
jgi:hypothetical protein